MQDIFQKVQTNFMELGVYFSGLDFEKDLVKPAVLKEANQNLSKSYNLFEAGLCEIAYMCNKCESRKSMMSRVVLLMRQCEKEQKMNEKAIEALSEFVQMIPATLTEMKTLYLASLSQSEA